MSMTIDRIGSIDPIQPGKKPGRTGQAKENPGTDSVSISSEAQQKAELYRAQELAAATPDMRLDRIAELKGKINDPSYIDDKVLNATANNLIDALFG
jgi:negative regulator of flagellin synthesis FlgM